MQTNNPEVRNTPPPAQAAPKENSTPIVSAENIESGTQAGVEQAINRTQEASKEQAQKAEKTKADLADIGGEEFDDSLQPVQVEVELPKSMPMEDVKPLQPQGQESITPEGGNETGQQEHAFDGLQKNIGSWEQNTASVTVAPEYRQLDAAQACMNALETETDPRKKEQISRIASLISNVDKAIAELPGDADPKQVEQLKALRQRLDEVVKKQLTALKQQPSDAPEQQNMSEEANDKIKQDAEAALKGVNFNDMGEADREIKIGQIMLSHGVSVNVKEDGSAEITMPTSGMDVAMNKIMGIITMLIGFSQKFGGKNAKPEGAKKESSKTKDVELPPSPVRERLQEELKQKTPEDLQKEKQQAKAETTQELNKDGGLIDLLEGAQNNVATTTAEVEKLQRKLKTAPDDVAKAKLQKDLDVVLVKQAGARKDLELAQAKVIEAEKKLADTEQDLTELGKMEAEAKKQTDTPATTAATETPATAAPPAPEGEGPALTNDVPPATGAKKK